MSTIVLYIKNISCPRCLITFKEILYKHGVLLLEINGGIVKIVNPQTEKKLKALIDNLKMNGFEIIVDKNLKLIEQIKCCANEWITSKNKQVVNYNFSKFISDKLGMNYRYLSMLFSEIENVTIEKYIIQAKIKKAKQLLIENELNLNEIAFELGYSSAAHLSGQFKQFAHVSPLQFKNELKMDLQMCC